MTDSPGPDPWVRCGTCHAPAVALVQVQGYDMCRDCEAFAVSPYRLRAQPVHVFVYSAGTLCFACGREKDDRAHSPGIAKTVPCTTNGNP